MGIRDGLARAFGFDGARQAPQASQDVRRIRPLSPAEAVVFSPSEVLRDTAVDDQSTRETSSVTSLDRYRQERTPQIVDVELVERHRETAEEKFPNALDVFTTSLNQVVDAWKGARRLQLETKGPSQSWKPLALNMPSLPRNILRYAVD